MRIIVDLASQRSPIHVITTATAVDCAKDVRLRRSFRHLMECIFPACCAFDPITDDLDSDESPRSTITSGSTAFTTTNIITGTIFGFRRGRISFCLHENLSSSRMTPLLLLDFAVPTAYLAKEMQHGVLRIALECERNHNGSPSPTLVQPLLSVPVWSMYCNGRKVGFAVRRAMTESDAAVFKLMRSVSAGAGVIPVSSKSGDVGELTYLRASFERVVGSVDSESFHMMNPVGSSGQQLSIFLLRT